MSNPEIKPMLQKIGFNPDAAGPKASNYKVVN
jgi:hypothetical protein